MTHLPGTTEHKRKPAWLRREIPRGKHLFEVRNILAELGLNTVCESAKCPNIGECFSRGTATFMIMGNTCTRNCRFCAVPKGIPEPLDQDEPRRLAEGARRLGLKHVVVTSVTRDDLPDGGAEHFVRTIEEIHKALPESVIEVLTPDFKGVVESIEAIVKAKPDIFNHNVETIPRLYPKVRPKASYKRSLEVLEKVKELDANIFTKSGLMLGLGESKDEVLAVMEDLRKVGCAILTIGQYMQPSEEHLPVEEFIHPQVFEEYGKKGEEMGFLYVASAPLVRSSFHAADFSQRFMPHINKPD